MLRKHNLEQMWRTSRAYLYLSDIILHYVHNLQKKWVIQ